MYLFIKKLFHKLYYKVYEGKVTTFSGLEKLSGYKWILGSSIGRAYHKGYYEPNVTKLFLKYLKQDTVFIDIGAHVGYYSLLSAASAPLGHVYSFEPFYGNYIYCNRIKELNTVSNWTIEQKAVGDRNGILYFNEGPTSTTGKVSYTEGNRVEAISIDNYLKEKSIKKIDLIKIDVEGFGGNVLRGAINTIKIYKPIIIMEFHSNSDEKEVFGELVSDDYNIYNLDKDAPIKLDEDNTLFVYAVPKENA